MPTPLGLPPALPALSVPAQSSTECSIASPALEQELDNWNTYYQQLLAGKLNQYAGSFIVFHNGSVIAQGRDPVDLRRNAADLLGIDGSGLVVPFIDDNESIANE